MKPVSLVLALALGAIGSVGCAADPAAAEESDAVSDDGPAEEPEDVGSSSQALCTFRGVSLQGTMAGGSVTTYRNYARSLLTSACFARGATLTTFSFSVSGNTYRSSGICRTCN